MKKIILELLLVFLVSFSCYKVSISPGYFSMHDDTQVARVTVMGRAIKNGQFPVRWVEGLGYGYGYPIFNFYGPLPYYVGGFFESLGVDGVVATKLMFLVGILIASFGMYVLGRFLGGGWVGLVMSALYTYGPYHAVQIYIRGAVGEYWAYACLPFIILGVAMYARTSTKDWGKLVGALGMAGVILSHTILGFVTVLLYILGVLVWGFVAKRKNIFTRSLLFHLVFIGIIGLSMSAFFWLPAIMEMKYTNVVSQIGQTSNFRDHFVCVSQFWNSNWGFGGSTPTCVDGLSYKLGKLHVILWLIGVGFAFVFRKKSTRVTLVVGLSTLLTLVALFFMTRASQPLWERMPFLAYIQYPWRLLTYALLGLSLAGGIWLVYVPKLLRWIVGIGLVLVIVLFNAPLFSPQYSYRVKSDTLTSRTDITDRASKLSDEYLPPEIVRPTTHDTRADKILLSDDSVNIDYEINKEAYKKLFVNGPSEKEVTLYRAYFPGWKYYVDEKEVTPIIDAGFPHFSVPEGRHAVEMKFTSTGVRTLGNIISLATLLVILYLYGKKSIN